MKMNDLIDPCILNLHDVDNIIYCLGYQNVYSTCKLSLFFLFAFCKYVVSPSWHRNQLIRRTAATLSISDLWPMNHFYSNGIWLLCKQCWGTEVTAVYRAWPLVSLGWPLYTCRFYCTYHEPAFIDQLLKKQNYPSALLQFPWSQ